MNPKLEQVLSHPHVWQASRGRRPQSVLGTGYGELDEALHDGGWPDNATTELLGSRAGMGELRLLLPGLRQIQRRRPWLIFIDPPYLPYAPALAQQSIDPQGLLILRPRSRRDWLWSAEQCLQSGCCGAVLNWASGNNLQVPQLRRLQQAAHRGQCWHILFRHPQLSRQPSPSALRLTLESDQGLLRVAVLKQRGGWSGQAVRLRLQPDLSQLQHLQPDQLPLPMAQFKYRRPTAAPEQTSSGGQVLPFPGSEA